LTRRSDVRLANEPTDIPYRLGYLAGILFEQHVGVELKNVSCRSSVQAVMD